MKKKLFALALLPAIVFVAAGATIATQVAAHGGSRPAAIESLVEKLGLDETEVKTAIEEIKVERKVEAETRYKEYLSALVTEGDLTEAQKQLILDKRAELKAKREAKKADLQTWSAQNGIDLKYLKGHRGFRGHGGFPKGF